MSNRSFEKCRCSVAWLAGLMTISSIGCTALPSQINGLAARPDDNSQPNDVARLSLSDQAEQHSIEDADRRATAVATTTANPAAPVISASAEAPMQSTGTTQVSSRAASHTVSRGIPVSMASCGKFGHSGCNSSVAGAAQCSLENGSACSCCSGACPPYQPGCVPDAQEFIFDGGDQQPTVVINQDWSAEGVDATDTVVYYETVTGELCLQPSNRVPIYAPRFGAVRQVSGAVLATKAVGTERILAPVSPGRFDDTDLANTVMQPLSPLGEQQVSLVEAFRERTAGRPLEGIVPPQRMSEALVPFEDIEVLPTGYITDDEIAVMGRILQNAQAWYVPENLGVIVDDQTAVLLIDTKQPLGVHVYDIPGKCTLRVCKTASHTVANSGDVVNFTIRFDNIGEKPVGNVVLVDSLSPRLEYIEGSQQSSVETRFRSEPNEAGSQILTWEVVSPIEEHDGGVVSFDCRVL